MVPVEARSRLVTIPGSFVVEEVVLLPNHDA